MDKHKNDIHGNSCDTYILKFKYIQPIPNNNNLGEDS